MRIVIDDTGSNYPLTVDPLLTSEVAKLTASDGGPDDYFGASVSVSGDTVVVGAYVDDVGGNSNRGSAYVFVRSDTSWSQQAKLTALDGADDDRFGRSVSQSANTVVVGSYLDEVGANGDQGSAYVYSVQRSAEDFDGDTKSDILWYKTTTGDVQMWFMNGKSIGSQGYAGRVGNLTWQIRGAGHFNEDTKADIVWRKNNTGDVHAWLMREHHHGSGLGGSCGQPQLGYQGRGGLQWRRQG